MNGWVREFAQLHSERRVVVVSWQDKIDELSSSEWWFLRELVEDQPSLMQFRSASAPVREKTFEKSKAVLIVPGGVPKAYALADAMFAHLSGA